MIQQIIQGVKYIDLNMLMPILSVAKKSTATNQMAMKVDRM